MNRGLTALVSIAGVLLLSGCKSGPLTTVKNVPLEVPAGWTKIDHSAQGISMAVPSGWEEYGAKSKDNPFAGMNGAGGKVDPDDGANTTSVTSSLPIFSGKGP